MRPVYLPLTLAELWQCRAQNPGALLYAGGTDLLVNMRSGNINPPALICLERLAELKGVEESPTEVRVGACATLADLLDHPLVQKNFPVLVKSLQVLGSPLIRQMGTIGGNICNASPAGDTLPPLYILQAAVELKSAQSLRTLPIAEFICGLRQTKLQPGEILSAVILPKLPAYNFHHFEKVGLRKSLACSIVSMAALMQLSEEGIIEFARLAWGSIGPTVVTSKACEELLIGKKLTEKTLATAAGLIKDQVSPIDDLRAEAAYRRTVCGNLLLRLADKAVL
ncbi:MAG: molybdopterin dehydrogenase [Deltaproteobacteria bacterium HGW-Deltaproteobacteria-9]|nr:MAG: molybdopterin dehydrogenase [Deltaproteobacteria bacterium HGW-Deltaproteobacteria-9]